MTEATEKIAAFVALRPREFSVLKTFTISQGHGPGGVYEQRVALVLVRDVDDDEESLSAEFYGVQHFTFVQSGFSVVNVHLEILAGSELDVDSTFVVHDAEQERVVSFECRDFLAYRT